MSKKLIGKALTKFEAERDVWREVLEGVMQIKAGGGKRTKIESISRVVQVRLKSGLSQAQFAAALGVSKRTLEQWEQGRREPSGAARTLHKDLSVAFDSTPGCRPAHEYPDEPARGQNIQYRL